MEFAKGDTIRHLGLLDLQRTMQRALRRSGLPILYSSGFNPHIVMSFASALSSGIPGDREILDVSLAEDCTEEECLSAMKKVLPPPLAPGRVRLVDSHFPKLGGLLTYASYRYTFLSDSVVTTAIPAFLRETEIMAVRKSKSREMLVNVREMVAELSATDGEMFATVSFTEAATLKPDLLLSTLADYAKVPVPETRIRRTGLYAGKPDALVSLMDVP